MAGVRTSFERCARPHARGCRERRRHGGIGAGVAAWPRWAVKWVCAYNVRAVLRTRFRVAPPACGFRSQHGSEALGLRTGLRSGHRRVGVLAAGARALPACGLRWTGDQWVRQDGAVLKAPMHAPRKRVVLR